MHEASRPWGSRSDRFQAPLPVTPLREHIPEMRSGRWSFAPKIDGQRMLMVIVADIINMRREKFICLLNRRQEVMLVPGMSISEFSVGSVLDCELVLIPGQKPVLSVFDCYSFGNKAVTKRTQTDRLKCVDTLFSSHMSFGEGDPVVLQTKRFYQLTPGDSDVQARVRGIWNACLQNQPFEGLPIDGLMLVDMFQAPCPGMCVSQQKMKAHHTIDLQARHIEGGGTSVGVIDRYGQVAELLRIDDDLEEGIWECLLDMNGCTPLKLRPDKSRPNTQYTLEQTQKTVLENVTIEDLIA